MKPSTIRIGHRYRASRLKEPYDAIVIGSGPGGLSAAACLSNMGMKVAVFEQHYTAGGFTHTYSRNGYEWDIGVHFINEAGTKGTLSSKAYNFITEGRLKWSKLPDDEYKLHINGETKDLSIKRKYIDKKLLDKFPEERDAIERFLQHCDKVTKKTLPGLLANKLLGDGFIASSIKKFAGTFGHKDAFRSTYDVLKDFTDNEELITLMSWWWVAFGLPIKQLPFIYIAIAMQSDTDTFFPHGGAAEMSSTVLPTLQKNDGELFTYATVEEILIENNQAVGVRMADGKEVRAPIVISNAGANNTFKHLLPDHSKDKQHYIDQLTQSKTSVAHICLFVGINAGQAELQLPAGNYLYYSSMDVSNQYKQFNQDPDSDFPFLYISFPSSKDPDWVRRYPDKSTAQIFTYIDNFEHFAEWQEETWAHRGEDYEQLKERYTQRILDVLYDNYPQLKGKVEYSELSTPLTTQTFSFYEQGEIYGLAHDKKRMSSPLFNNKTKVDGLYLTGQDSLTVGHIPSTFSGILTAYKVLGFRKGIQLFKKIGADCYG